MEKAKKTKSLTLGALITGSAIIWAAVLLACSFKLKGTECYKEIQNILAIGVITHILVIWGPMGAMLKKMRTDKEQQE